MSRQIINSPEQIIGCRKLNAKNWTSKSFTSKIWCLCFFQKTLIFIQNKERNGLRYSKKSTSLIKIKKRRCSLSLSVKRFFKSAGTISQAYGLVRSTSPLKEPLHVGATLKHQALQCATARENTRLLKDQLYLEGTNLQECLNATAYGFVRNTKPAKTHCTLKDQALKGLNAYKEADTCCLYHQVYLQHPGFFLGSTFSPSVIPAGLLSSLSWEWSFLKMEEKLQDNL